MVPPPQQGRSGERGGLVTPMGELKYKLSCSMARKKSINNDGTKVSTLFSTLPTPTSNPPGTTQKTSIVSSIIL